MHKKNLYLFQLYKSFSKHVVDHILYNELEISHGVNQQSSSIDNNDIDMLSQDENIDSNDIDNHQEDVQIHDDSK